MISTSADIIERIYASGDTIPVSELDPAFFDLSSGVAGEIVQALANYRLTATIVGELPPHSTHFADFAREVPQLTFRPA
ncbi:DUF4180 domain-containing protein [Solirubrobacter sp. CPCC 204708]|uniref:DUF4180 domain-containing protein n=1 Tax=Solirubrobacter deserti TaxID=2282478 RepID=A0ABT4REK3_9ACTN|nr:DUF4180 domain-containing protein [Solirubrobacter deserti]MBE2316039.1 DUF4180 domain-containing protein [Solirubrobacter deserti]MDA0136791.1 DUF4180 domain-containing protein [Solirubrobacter deserti]